MYVVGENQKDKKYLVNPKSQYFTKHLLSLFGFPQQHASGNSLCY